MSMKKNRCRLAIVREPALQPALAQAEKNHIPENTRRIDVPGRPLMRGCPPFPAGFLVFGEPP